MALSDQIKVPAQVKGAVGGGGSGGGSSAFGDITGWPGASTDFIRGDGSDGPLSATDIPALDTAKITTGQFVDARMPTASNAATIGAISIVANAALPKAGGTMTGIITLSGTFGGSSGDSWIGNDGSGPIVNSPTGTGLRVVQQGTTVAQFGTVLQSSVPISLLGTQASAGASVNNIYRDSNGFTRINTAIYSGTAIDVNGTEQVQFSAGGIRLVGTQVSLGGSITQIWRDSAGNLIENVASGSAFAFNVNLAQQAAIGTTGITLATAHTAPANTAYGVWREATLSQAVVQGPTTGCAALYGADGATIKAHGLSEALRPTSITLKSPGKPFTNNGTWTNFYSLAEGTHAGIFRIYTNLYTSTYQVGIVGTTIAEVFDGWTVGDLTAAAGVIAFRVSGGFLQINVGTSISASGYYHAVFEGNVR